MLRVVVVDDEAPARRYLLRLLSAHADLEVVGEASSRAGAARIISGLSPDAVFMDIELGDGDGMEFWARSPRPPLIIFVTAHADRAAQAFDVAALDYLLKPVGAERMASAIGRLRLAHALRGSPISASTQTHPSPPAMDEAVVVRDQSGARVIKTKSISAIVAKGDYVELHLAERKSELMYVTLTRLAERLPSPPFARLSRSLLLNLDHIAEVRSIDSLRARVAFITRATPVDLGRVAANRLRKIFIQRL